MNKRLIFDTVRAMLGRRFTKAEVERLDRVLDLGETAASVRLGALSERFESGGRGPGAVSSGKHDPGGVSYGIWQLSSRAGTAAAFIAAEGAPWRAEFGSALPGSAAFSVAWRTVAAREPEAFAEAQHAFIERTHYRPAVVAVKARTGVDLDARAPALRDACWSVAVQHGGAAKILSAAVVRAEAGDDRALLEAIYAERTGYVLALARRAGLGSATGRMLEGIAHNRYPAELAAARAMLLKDSVVPA